MAKRPKNKSRKCLYIKPATGIIHYKKKMPGIEKPLQGSTYTSDWKVAQAVLKAITDQAALLVAGNSDIRTLGDLMADWYTTMNGAVSQRYRDDLKATITTNFGHLFSKPLGYFRTSVVIKLRANYLLRAKKGVNRKGAKCTPGGANTTFRQFKTLFLYAVEMDYLLRVPFRLKKLRIKRKRRPFVRMSQLSAYLAQVDKLSRSKATRLAIRLMIGLGLRLAEVRKARWEWIDWDVRTYTPIDGKSGGDYGLPLMGWVADYLLQMAPEGKNTQGLMIKGRTLIPRDEEERNRFFNPRKTVVKAGENIGIKGLTNHRLRGTLATLLGRAGVPLSLIQVYMRHDDANTTNIYMEKDLDRLEEAALRFQKKLQEVCPGADLVNPVLCMDEPDEGDSESDEEESELDNCCEDEDGEDDDSEDEEEDEEDDDSEIDDDDDDE